MKNPKLSVRIPKEDLDAMDGLITAQVFESRSAFTRKAIQQLLRHYEEYEESLRRHE